MEPIDPNLPKASTPGPSDAPTSTSPPKYVPQFSAATEMLLKRINSGAGSSNFTSNLSSIGITGTPPGYEDMRRNVLMGMKTSMNMEIPSAPPVTGRRNQGGRSSVGSSSSAAKAPATPRGAAKNNGTPTGSGKGKQPRAKAGKKRKRKEEEESEESEEESDVMSKLGDDSSDSDGSGSISNFPKVTQSGRAVVKPTQFVPEVRESSARKRAPSRKNQEQALCKKCQRGHSPTTNQIVFCDGCNGGWHQMCHDPAISDEAVKDEKEPWFCTECTIKRARKSGSAEVRGVSWQGRSTDDKRAYFQSLSQPHLVSLLLQTCVLYPNIPIFPPIANGQPIAAYKPPSNPSSRPSSSHPPQSQNQRASHAHPPTPFPPSATAGLFARAEANPGAPMNFIRKIAPGSKTSATPPAQYTEFKHSSSAPPQLPPQYMGGDDSRESTPASPPYPRPGNGLMAKLGPDEDDMEWLVDDNDFEAFSHTVFSGVNGGL